jgi:signal peptidase II
VRIYLAILASVLVADQVTKFWITSHFSLYDAQVLIPGFFNLVYVTNKGVAFSMFASVESPLRHYFFVSINIIAFLGLSIAAFKMRRNHLLYTISFALIAAGALGNVIDRIRYGAVIDFLDFYFGSYHWPAFNVADSSICVGVVILFIINYVDAKKDKA